jgi:gamma-glutamylcyclotransferase
MPTLPTDLAKDSMTRFVYFAYGSNMLTERLAARCPSAEPLGRAEAPGFFVSYCLGSPDGSAKAGLRPAEDESVWGVLFSLNRSERAVLDGFEGAPILYARTEIEVFPDGSSAPALAVTYLPQPAHIVSNRLPYAWYRALCVGGARQHRLAERSISRLATGENMAMPGDPEAPAWEGRTHALLALDAAGRSVCEDEGVR